MLRRLAVGVVILGTALAAHAGTVSLDSKDFIQWKLPQQVPEPAGNETTAARVDLGRMLFFDPRFSGNSNMSCASCHNPSLGWSDGLDTAVGHNGKKLGRATPTIVNSGYYTIFMWDGRKASLEDQAVGPMQSADEMRADWPRTFELLTGTPAYVQAFGKAYPGAPIDEHTFAKAIAAFERTVVTRDSDFDRWLAGDKKAMPERAQRGFALFVDPAKGNCAGCHVAPNFSDNGFHNVGLASFGAAEPDLGRYNERRVALMKGAFKTPQLRDIARTAPYFHDGSARSLRDVVEHYRRGGDSKTNLSPDLKPLNVTDEECDELVAFLEALTGNGPPIQVPLLP